jgi:hypothetical protein
MRCLRWHVHVTISALVVCLLVGACPTLGQSASAECPAGSPIRLGNACLCHCPKTAPVQVGNLCLRETSIEIAEEVCLRDGTVDPQQPDGSKTCAYQLIKDLSEMPGRCHNVEALVLRQEITEMVFTASLQVDGFLSEIDSETAEIRAVHDQLSDLRDKAIQHSTLGSVVSGIGGAVGSALALASDAASTVGDYIGATSGAAGAFFDLLGYFQQRGPKGCFPDLREKPKDKDVCPKLDKADADHSDEPEGKEFCIPNWTTVCDATASPRSGCSPRMLYPLLFPKCNEWAGFHGEYDDPIQTYLASKPPGKQENRGDALIKTWGQKDELRENTSLFTSNSTPRKLSIDQLADRANKLDDLRTLVSRMNRDLSRLTEDLAQGLRCGKLPAANSQAGVPSSAGSE